MDKSAPAWEKFNALNFPAPVDGSWSTTNLSEALPGVATPLGFSIWSRAADLAARAPFWAMGAMTRADLHFPARSEERVVNLFFGRIAIRVDFFCEMGDLVPGATGEAVARDAFGFVPPGFVSHASKRRWPAFFVKMPLTFARTPGRIRQILTDTEAWYRLRVPRLTTLELAEARTLYADAKARFEHTLQVNATSIACVIQPVYTALSKAAAEAGIDTAELMRAQGSHEEAAMIENLWKLSRDRITLEDFLLRHGYHGPNEGELSNPTWRQDPAPLTALIEAYRNTPDSEGPIVKAAAGAAERERAEARLLAAVPASRRGGVKLTLILARKHLPLRAVGKVAFLRQLDIARGAALRAGTLLAADGVLREPDDVFYLTSEELCERLPADVGDVVEERRGLRAVYQRYELPTHWTGLPQVSPIQADYAPVDRLVGIGVSPGVVEGRIRVVTDPSSTEMDGHEILVARTTDPSWASVMFLAQGLVVDIGGQMSHAAVVARELGVPCVMNTQVGTRTLRTGDLARVDGSTGVVEVLERAV
jgi:pyruvate,water dikinase